MGPGTAACGQPVGLGGELEHRQPILVGKEAKTLTVTAAGASAVAVDCAKFARAWGKRRGRGGKEERT